MCEKDALAGAIAWTLKYEGLWYAGDDARDPHPTMKGVTQMVYDNFREKRGLPTQSVRKITDEEVETIYRGYWTGGACDRVYAHVGELSARNLFDMSINAGFGGAVKVLQAALGVTVDGAFGPKSLAALTAVTMDDRTFSMELYAERIAYYQKLAQSARLRPNLNSWVHRCVKYRREFLKP